MSDTRSSVAAFSSSILITTDNSTDEHYVKQYQSKFTCINFIDSLLEVKTQNNLSYCSFELMNSENKV